MVEAATLVEARALVVEAKTRARAKKGKGNGEPAVFVGGLSYDTTTESLRYHFESYGEVTYARVMTDRESGRSRGCGKVAFSTEQERDDAIAQLDQSDLDGRTISVRAFT